MFERFLNPGRISMPDIDLDFRDDRRVEMLEYCSRKYGNDKVAQIITFGTMGTKAALARCGACDGNSTARSGPRCQARAVRFGQANHDARCNGSGGVQGDLRLHSRICAK